NPLPGLTPDYSDLVLISKAAGITYRTLIGEILAGSLKRLREKRREAVPKAAGEEKRERTDRVEKIDAPKPEVATQRWLPDGCASSAYRSVATRRGRSTPSPTWAACALGTPRSSRAKAPSKRAKARCARASAASCRTSTSIASGSSAARSCSTARARSR